MRSHDTVPGPIRRIRIPLRSEGAFRALFARAVAGLAAALVAAGAAAACAAPPSPPAPEPWAVLRVGTSGDYAPFSLDGAGFDVEVAQALAAELGARLVWVRFEWPTLRADLEAGRFDVAMSGVTWRPERALQGYLTRAVAAGGPCVIGARSPVRVGVNRGGVLEDWARARFPDSRLLAVADNRSLPARLAAGEVDAIVTDSFELAHFQRPGDPAWCAPPRERKVYWVAPAPRLGTTGTTAAQLGARIDRFLREREPWLQAQRRRYLGAPAPRDAVDHLVDLLARRLELMPGVAAFKRVQGVALEDGAREARVLERASRRARALQLDPAAVRALFALQIELARALQQRAPAAPPLELEAARAQIGELGDRILDALVECGPLGSLPLERLELLDPWLATSERERLRAALIAAAPRRPR
jgi:chorismate mutase-like protein